MYLEARTNQALTYQGAYWYRQYMGPYRANRYTADPDGTGPADAFSFGNPDFRYRSLRSNLVLRWEYMPGSTLFLVWNHGQSGYGTDPTFRVFDQLGSMFGDDQQNTFLVKVNYWLSR